MHMMLTVILGISEFTVSKLFACLTANRSCEEETTGSAPLNYNAPHLPALRSSRRLGKSSSDCSSSEDNANPHLITLQVIVYELLAEPLEPNGVDLLNPHNPARMALFTDQQRYRSISVCS